MPQFLKICITAYGTSKRYNSVPVKNNYVLFAPRGRAIEASMTIRDCL